MGISADRMEMQFGAVDAGHGQRADDSINSSNDKAVIKSGNSFREGNTYRNVPPAVINQALLAAANSLLTMTTTAMADMNNPTDYLIQVKKSREIWGGVYSDSNVSMVMDTYVSAVVAFGSENLIKRIKDRDIAQAKEVVDHWFATLNAGLPMLSSGLDSIRKQMHKYRWQDGRAVPTWTPLETCKTWSGITYQAPKQMAVFSGVGFETVPSNIFGGFRLKLRDTTVDPSTETTAIEDSASPVRVDMGTDYLTDNRYHVFDWNRMESTQQNPVPFLVWRGAVPACAMLRTLSRGDYQTAKRIIRMILLFTRGSDAWTKVPGNPWNPSDVDFSDLISTISEGGDDSFNNIIGTDYTTNARYIAPDMQAMLSADKFVHPVTMLLASLGMGRIMETDQGRKFIYNPKPFLMEFQDAVREDKRFVESVLMPILWDNNPGIFGGIEPANFFVKPNILLWDLEDKKAVQYIFEMGGSRGMLYDLAGGLGMDAEADAWRVEQEREDGYDEIFQNRTTFTQGVEPNAATAEITAEESFSLTDDFDGVKAELLDELNSDDGEEKKRSVLKYILLTMLLAFWAKQEASLKQIYGAQFGEKEVDWKQYLKLASKQKDNIDNLGTDILNKLYAVIGMDDRVSGLDGVYKSVGHRVSLYNEDPYKYAEFAGQGAVAYSEGMLWAQRHSAFANTTCGWCIEHDGEFLPIDKILEGDWDHPHGLCTLTFHEKQA